MSEVWIKAMEKDTNGDYIFHWSNKTAHRVLAKDYRKLTDVKYDLGLTYNEAKPYFIKVNWKRIKEYKMERKWGEYYND